jgi:hypothetical protein
MYYGSNVVGIEDTSETKYKWSELYGLQQQSVWNANIKQIITQVWNKSMSVQVAWKASIVIHAFKQYYEHLLCEPFPFCGVEKWTK